MKKKFRYMLISTAGGVVLVAAAFGGYVMWSRCEMERDRAAYEIAASQAQAAHLADMARERAEALAENGRAAGRSEDDGSRLVREIGDTDTTHEYFQIKIPGIFEEWGDRAIACKREENCVAVSSDTNCCDSCSGGWYGTAAFAKAVEEHRKTHCAGARCVDVHCSRSKAQTSEPRCVKGRCEAFYPFQEDRSKGGASVKKKLGLSEDPIDFLDL